MAVAYTKIDKLESPIEDWFSFEGDEELASTKRYLKDHVIKKGFDDSTDSDTEDEAKETIETQ